MYFYANIRMIKKKVSPERLFLPHPFPVPLGNLEVVGRSGPSPAAQSILHNGIMQDNAAILHIVRAACGNTAPGVASKGRSNKK